MKTSQLHSPPVLCCYVPLYRQVKRHDIKARRNELGSNGNVDPSEFVAPSPLDRYESHREPLSLLRPRNKKRGAEHVGRKSNRTEFLVIGDWSSSPSDWLICTAGGRVECREGVGACKVRFVKGSEARLSRSSGKLHSGTKRSLMIWNFQGWAVGQLQLPYIVRIIDKGWQFSKIWVGFDQRSLIW